MSKIKNLNKKKIAGIVVMSLALILVPFAKVSIDFNNLLAYGAAQITGFEKPGDQITKLHSDGQDWLFTSPIDATYTIELFGPKANGNNAGNGGSVRANIALNAGDTIDIYLGPGAPAGDGTRNAAKGNSGSGYGDSGIYKSIVKLNNEVYIVAGGGGSQGNPGVGDRSEKFMAKDSCKNKGCPYSDGQRHHTMNGVGGAGGAGADGGNNSISIGENGKAGSAEYWTFEQMTYYDHYLYLEGGTGGAGGDGGASYVGTKCSDFMFSKGLGQGESKIIITMGAERLPELDANLIMDMKREIIQTLGDKIDMINNMPSSGGETIPQITVVQGKYFRKVIPSYTDMQSGASSGVNVEKSGKSDKTMTVTGTLSTLGYQEIIINDQVFIFNVISEPDSSNVKVIFD